MTDLDPASEDNTNFRELVQSDWARLCVLKGQPAGTARFYHVLHPRFSHVYLIRLFLYLNARNQKFLSRVISIVLVFLHRIEISGKLVIGPGLVIPHSNGIVLGASAIGKNVTIFQNTTLGAKYADFVYREEDRPVVLDDVTIGAGAVVLGGVTIGPNAAIASNSLVTESVAPDCLAIGVPAKSRPRQSAKK